jgi:dienelactone hydrolase
MVVPAMGRILSLCLIVSIPAGGLAAEDPERPVVCPYESAHTAPLDETKEIIAEADDHILWRVEFNGIKKDRVPAYLYVPKNGQARHPAVLLQYGSGGDKKVDYIVALGRQFVNHGFVVLTIDSPGRGERRQKGAKKTDWLFSNQGRDVFLQYCGDYSRAVDYLVSRPDVQDNRIAYVGISWGAITGVTFVAHDPRVKAMGSMVGGGNFLGLAGVFSGKNGDDSGADVVSIDPARHVGQIAPRPLLLLNVTRDQLVPRPFAEALHKAAGEGSKKVWLETDHYFTGIDRTELGETVIRFIEESLKTTE